jgi:hypothetical protein
MTQTTPAKSDHMSAIIFHDHIFIRGVSTMRHASYSVTGVPPEPSPGTIISRQVSKLTGNLFLSILRALHESRRLQAQRVLSQYQHLIDRSREKQADAPKSDSGRP